MSPLLRTAILLGAAWLAGLILVVVAPLGVPIGEAPSRFRLAIGKVGEKGAAAAIGLAFVVIIALLVDSVLPPARSETNTRRIEALEKWRATHDSLHARADR